MSLDRFDIPHIYSFYLDRFPTISTLGDGTAAPSQVLLYLQAVEEENPVQNDNETTQPTMSNRVTEIL